MTELRGRRITAKDDAVPLADHPTAANNGTDPQKVGFVFSGRVTLVEVKVVR